MLGQSHGHPFRASPDYARTAIRALGTCPGFSAALNATATRRYRRPGAPIDAQVTARDHLLLRRQSRRLDELSPGTRLGVLPGCGHLPMADNLRAVTALITASTARGLPSERQALLIRPSSS